MRCFYWCFASLLETVAAADTWEFLDGLGRVVNKSCLPGISGESGLSFTLASLLKGLGKERTDL